MSRSAPAPSPVPHPLPEPLIALIAQRFRILAEPMRLKLLDHLRDGGATMGELQEALGASQQNISKHLAILHGADMIERTKIGKQVRYALSDPSVFELCGHVCVEMRRELQQREAILGETA